MFKNEGQKKSMIHILHVNFCMALGCAVLIAETMLDEQTPYSTLQSLNMLVQTEGTERTQRQYVDLLRKHGFGEIRVVHTKNFLDAIFSIKMLHVRD